MRVFDRCLPELRRESRPDQLRFQISPESLSFPCFHSTFISPLSIRVDVYVPSPVKLQYREPTCIPSKTQLQRKKSEY